MTVAATVRSDVAAVKPGKAADALRWRRHLVVLAAAAAALLVLFRHDVGDLAHQWWTSTTYGHCLFVGPVIAWLVWQRRAEVARLIPVAWAPGLLAVAVAALAWLVGEAASAAVVRQLALVAMLAAVVATLLGPVVARGLMFPLSYAVFLVPMGEGLEAPLQQVTVAIAVPLLHAVAVPASVDGVLIHAGRYWFEVAEACSGSKFVIAMVAFGVLVAHQGFLAWRRRAAFLAVCLVVPVIANGVRAFATMWAADLTSVEAATGFDHIIYGWLFFAAVMAAVIAVAWRWFDRPPDAPAFDPAELNRSVRHRVALVPAALAAVGVPLAAVLWSAAGAPAVLPARVDLPLVAGWTRADLSTRAPWQPDHPGADHHLFGRYVDQRGDAVDMGVAVFARQRDGAELVASGTGVLREEDRWLRVADEAPIAGGSAMRIRAPGPVERIVATWYRVGDGETTSPDMVKLMTARARLFGAAWGGGETAVALHLSAEVVPGHDPRAAIARFRRALGVLYVPAAQDAR